MGILKSATVGVTTTGSAGSGAGNSDSETFAGEIVGIYVNHHANAPATTDITITDKRTGVTILNVNNSAADAYFAPRAKAVDSANANLLSSDANGVWAVPYVVDQGVNVAVAGGNSITNHAVVTVFYRR